LHKFTNLKFNTKYNLRNQNPKAPQKVHLVCRWNGERLVYPTAFNVLPKNWNTAKGEVRNTIDEPNRLQINAYLNELQATAHNAYTLAVTSNTPLIEFKPNIKNYLDKYTGKVVEVKATFWNYVTDYVEKTKARQHNKTGKILSYRTVQEFNTTIKILKEFEKLNKQTLDFDNINLNTIIDFRDFCTTVKKYAVNNIAKHIDNFRQFLRNAHSDKISIDTDTIDNKKFTTAREIAQNVYLNENELKQIELLNLDTNNKLDKARDLFLIGCYTGLRISDYNNIKPHNIKGNFIEIYQSKTSAKVVIPIHPTVKNILAKYNGITPPKISDQRLNDYIKEVCQLASIDDPTEKQQTKGGERLTMVCPKWQFVTSHTARRTFASNAVKQGVPIQTIMKITGHAKETTFVKYVKLSASEHAEIMAKHWNAITELNNN
jgi:integrase